MSEEHESSEPTSGDDVTLRPLSPSETESPERNGAFTVSRLFSSRAILTKILAIVSFVLFIICIALIAVLVQEKKSGSTIAQQTDNKVPDTFCSYSEEARRIGLPEFLKKVKTAFYEYNSDKIAKPRSDVLDRHLPYNYSPAYLKERTDVALSLLNEIKNKSMDENKMKPREVKGVEQVKLFLKTIFSTPYDGNFYDGDWLLGPNHFCWQPVCRLGFSLVRYGIWFKPANATELEEVLRRIALYGETLKQYKSNMKSGVKAGMVRSYSSCRSGLNAFKYEFNAISRHNNPKDVLKEWCVQDFVKSSYIKNISIADRQNWVNSKGKNISTSITDALIEGIGKPIVDLINYMEDEHLRHCLPPDVSSGLASLPVAFIYLDGKRTAQRTTQTLPLTGQALSGKNTYKNTIPYFTTTEITPDEIHKRGKEMLKVFYSQAIEIAKTVTGESDNDTAILEFRKTLNSSEHFFNSEPFPANESDANAYKRCSSNDGVKRYCPKRWAAMQKWLSSVRATMGMLAPKLVPLFHHVGKKNTMPNCPIQVIANRNPSAGVQVFYNPGGTCRRPAKYALPLFLDNYGPKFTQWSVTAHETWPGHHTQLQGQGEHFQDKCKDSLSWVDLQSYLPFFTEGWAMYAESPLTDEDMNIYEDHPLKKYGMLQWQIWRALRLIIDTGLHYRGMNRTTALRLLSKYAWDNTDLSEKEVTRYQGAPGQATSYLLGQQKLVQLRKYCKTKLGNQFNLKDFHFQILSQGTTPASYLDKHVKKYVKCTLGELKGEVCDIILNPPTKQVRDPKSDSTQELDLLPMPSRRHYV